MKDILTALRDAASIHNSQLLKITKTNELTISEWKLLSQVINGNNTQEHLSKATSLDVSTLSRQLKRLVEKQMLSKEAVGRDKRQLLYHVTDKGSQANKQISQLSDKLEKSIFNHWTDEEKNLLKILINRLEKSLQRISD